jgi:hypothetical protein
MRALGALFAIALVACASAHRAEASRLDPESVTGRSVVVGTGFETNGGCSTIALEPRAATASLLLATTPALRSLDDAVDPPAGGGHHAPLFGADRARVLLRSLTFPGWGQATSGHKTSASIFAVAEAGIWGSFTAFRIQQVMRRHSYELTARLLAGIDLNGRDEEFRRIVGFYGSSDQYNLFVVYRDAANLYLSNPDHLDYAGYHRYIAEHELKGADTWRWQDAESLDRYRFQRRQTHRAELRANTALALAIIDRLISALHAARYAGQISTEESHPRSFKLEVSPSDPADPTAYRFGVRARF